MFYNYYCRYELEESSEFLQPVDSGAPVLVDEDDYAALEDIKTKLYPGPPSTTHYTYDRVPWTLKIRKEVFSPSETLNSPLAINLIFCQVCLLSNKELTKDFYLLYFHISYRYLH